MSRPPDDRPENDLEWTLVRRPRVTRRMHLELDAEGRLVVVAPRHLDHADVQALLVDNRTQVDRFLTRARARHLPPLRYVDGEQHLYRGSRLRLHLRKSRTPGVHVEHDELQLAAPELRPHDVRRRLAAWYRAEAACWFAERLAVVRQRTPWAREQALTLDRRRMKRTWGTCRANGTLRFNTHLVKAPEATVDYVIAHELCHLKVMNHGPDFYRLQSEVCPDWRRQRDRLRRQGHHYLRE